MLKHDGFTLVELILGFVLLGILAVSVTTLFIDFRQADLDVVTKKIRSDIEHARGLAMMKKGTNYGVFFDDSSDRYTVYQGTIVTPVSNPLTQQSLVEDFAQWPGVTITGGNYTVEFSPVGAPTSGGGGSVQITDGSRTKTITVSVGTGRVSIQ